MPEPTLGLIRGGSFLVQDLSPEEVFTPEDFTEEHRMIAETAQLFMENEVFPRIEEIENRKEGVNEEILRKAAQIGLVAAGIPEEYGGEGLDQVSVAIISDKSGLYGSFATTFGAHAGIGTLPILYFGSDQQKAKYLPKLATAEWIGAYALTEAESGSDALAAKTRAVLSPDGTHYVLNGTKMWITNAGFAHVFITFAKIDGDKFTAFIIERNFPGVSTGAEEHKMGIRGSSTRTLILENAEVPVENVLGEIGRGHLIAFNILNFGRFKLGATAIGGIKYVTNEAIRYAKERRQFGKSIIEFGAVQHKLAEMAVRIFCAESMVYRTAGMIDTAMKAIDKSSPQFSTEILKEIEDYAVECSIIKVANSEILDFIVDEAVQIYGGYGYSGDYPVERCYRDARINRIFEGTNEINRLLISGMLLKRAMKGQLPLISAAQKVASEILSVLPITDEGNEALGTEKTLVANCKKIFLLTAGAAVQKFREALSEQQEVLSLLSDLVISIFAMESMLSRARKAVSRSGEGRVGLQLKAVRIGIDRMLSEVENNAKQILAAVSEGDELRTQLAALRRFSKHVPVNVIALRQAIARKLDEEGKYCLS
jgi:alkylation response protein AidB-like acyl-CoA dehydrogenase